MTTEELRYRVYRCIAKKQEGDSWDFKRQWYDKDKEKTDLLHDIICMANLIKDEDGLIIIGVDEEHECSICDVSGDPNRKNTHEMVKFLRDKPFDGGIRPTVYVESIEVNQKTIDVIVIENSLYVPFYLTDRFQQVEAYHIYTRVGDSNTPIDKSADRDKVEALWKKRFGLNKPTLEKFKIYLRDYKHWVSVDGEQSWYYEYAPEYRIETDLDESSNAYNYYCFTQIDSRPSYYNLRLMYHQIVVADTLAVCLDGGRFITAVPWCHTFGQTPYYYYETDRINYHLHCFFEMRADDKFYSNYAYDRWNECVPTVGTKEQAEDFFEWLKYQRIPTETERTIPPISDRLQNGEDGERYRIEYKHAMIINDMLEKYWKESFQSVVF